MLDHLRKADVVRMMEDKDDDSPQRGSAVRALTHKFMQRQDPAAPQWYCILLPVALMVITLGWANDSIVGIC